MKNIPKLYMMAVEIDRNTVGAEQVLLPAGPVLFTDGMSDRKWQISESVLADTAGRMKDLAGAGWILHVDFDGQLFGAWKPGSMPPTAGEAKNFEFVPGRGLIAKDLKWSAMARQMIKDMEYYYLVVTVAMDLASTDSISHILMGSLCNTPQILASNVLANPGASANLSALLAPMPQVVQKKSHTAHELQVMARLGLSAQQFDMGRSTSVNASTSEEALAAATEDGGGVGSLLYAELSASQPGAASATLAMQESVIRKLGITVQQFLAAK